MTLSLPDNGIVQDHVFYCTLDPIINQIFGCELFHASMHCTLCETNLEMLATGGARSAWRAP